MKRDLFTIDFETDKIEPRPSYPPKPVGVSIRYASGKLTYLAWGHPCNNNSTKAEAIRILKPMWKSAEMIFHNSKFDLDVGEVHLGLKMPPWHRVHDTLYLLFLYDPHSKNLGLKPSAEKILGMPPEEQELLRQWLIDSKIVKKNDKQWGAHIGKGPGDLVGKYANGDTLRTYKLFKKLMKYVKDNGMEEAYNRERQVMPILLRNETEGVRINVRRLEKDIDRYTSEFKKVSKYLEKKLKVPLTVDPHELNLDSDRQVANRLDHLEIVTEWTLTPTGLKSMAKKNLHISMFHDKKFALAYAYRTRLGTCLGTFMENWLETAHKTGGLIHTNWNQVRQAKDQTGGNFAGARTGRLSATPNLMNIPTSFYNKDDGYKHPKTPVNLCELPLVRQYILPDKGHVFGHRDYDQQELRILAYFENADMYQAYLTNPALDMHLFVQTMLREVAGVDLLRKAVKIINFGIIYGMGLTKLAGDLGIEYNEAKKIKNGHAIALPGVKDLEEDLKDIGKRGDCIITWGGRQYFAEEPKMLESGYLMEFFYKLLNYLIQGSAAECTKQAVINYDDIQQSVNSEARFLVTVHDEINNSMPRGNKKQEMLWLKEAMEMVEFEDMLMATTGGVGPNWADIKNYQVPGDVK